MTDISSLDTDGVTQESLRKAERQVVKWRRRRRWTLGISGFLYLFQPVLFVILKPETQAGLPAGLIVVPLLLSMIGFLFGILMRPTRGNALNRLWNSQDVQAIGPLAEATQMLLPEMNIQAMTALKRLLPMVKYRNVPLLTSYQRVCLHRLLGNFTKVEVNAPTPTNVLLGMTGIPRGLLIVESTFTRAGIAFDAVLAESILYAYIHMGSHEDVRVVHCLSKPGNLISQSVASASLQKTAQEILPLLEERVKQEDFRVELLRPVGGPSDRMDDLLRAASLDSDPKDNFLKASQLALSASESQMSLQQASRQTSDMTSLYTEENPNRQNSGQVRNN